MQFYNPIGKVRGFFMISEKDFCQVAAGPYDVDVSGTNAIQFPVNLHESYGTFQ